MERRFWIWRSRFGWWVAVNPDETTGLYEGQTHYRSFSRDRLVEKMQRKLAPQPFVYEEIAVK